MLYWTDHLSCKDILGIEISICKIQEAKEHVNLKLIQCGGNWWRRAESESDPVSLWLRFGLYPVVGGPSGQCLSLIELQTVDHWSRTHFYQKEESSWGHIRVSLVLILQAFVLETEGRARGCCAVCLVAFWEAAFAWPFHKTLTSWVVRMLQTPLFGAYNRLLKLDSWSRQTNHQLIVSYCGQSQFTCGEGSLARARNSSAGPEGSELMGRRPCLLLLHF